MHDSIVLHGVEYTYNEWMQKQILEALNSINSKLDQILKIQQEKHNEISQCDDNTLSNNSSGSRPSPL